MIFCCVQFKLKISLLASYVHDCLRAGIELIGVFLGLDLLYMCMLINGKFNIFECIVSSLLEK
jgi:hypothetical protein